MGESFLRDDGSHVKVVPGFQAQTRTYRPASSPQDEWTDADYAAAAAVRREGFQNRYAAILRRRFSLKNARVLELGCGSGFDVLQLGMQPVTSVIGLDMELPLFHQDAKGDRVRRLLRTILVDAGWSGSIAEALEHFPVLLTRGHATHMPFADESFDFISSRSVLQHVTDLQKVLKETGRVMRAKGWAYHIIDPFYWLRGCHKRGLVDIPWAHARLSLPEYRRFVVETEGEAKARKRVARLQALNRLTLDQWRDTIEASPFEIVRWKEIQSGYATQLLAEHPDVEGSLLEGVQPRDLIHSRIKVWLRKRKGYRG